MPRSVSPRPSPSPARDTLRTVARPRTRTLTRFATSWSRPPSSRKNRQENLSGGFKEIHLSPTFISFFPVSECVSSILRVCVCVYAPLPSSIHHPRPPLFLSFRVKEVISLLTRLRIPRFAFLIPSYLLSVFCFLFLASVDSLLSLSLSPLSYPRTAPFL